jgi:hypothetical protein
MGEQEKNYSEIYISGTPEQAEWYDMIYTWIIINIYNLILL